MGSMCFLHLMHSSWNYDKPYTLIVKKCLIICQIINWNHLEQIFSNVFFWHYKDDLILNQERKKNRKWWLWFIWTKLLNQESMGGNIFSVLILLVLLQEKIDLLINLLINELRHLWMKDILGVNRNFQSSVK